ncbi:transcription elongation factor B polypeptide 3 [Cryptosporidium felis]|nr:transcription elongation factor B polypeptide 3 [Cryptosporidium felis]
MDNNVRLSCKGLLRESLSLKKEFPKLTTLCINKLRTMRSSLSNLKEKEVPKELLHLIFKGSTCHELLNAEKNNSGIQNMFGGDSGQAWDALWETAVKVRYCNNMQIFQRKEDHENYREFFLRNQEDTENRFKSQVLKRSRSIDSSRIRKVPDSDSTESTRRALSLHHLKHSDIGQEPKRSIHVLENIPRFSTKNQFYRYKNPKMNGFNKVQRSNNPILREYFQQKSKSINYFGVRSSEIERSTSSISKISSANGKAAVTFKFD